MSSSSTNGRVPATAKSGRAGVMRRRTSQDGLLLGGLFVAGVAVTSGAVLVAPAAALGLLGLLMATLAAARLGISLAGGSLAFLVAASGVQGAMLSAGLPVGSLGLTAGGAAALAAAANARAILRGVQERPGVLIAAVTLLIGLATLELFNPALPSLSYAFEGYRTFALPLVVLLVAAFAQLRRTDVRLIVGVVLAVWVINLAYALRQGFIGFSGGEIQMLRQNASAFKVGADYRLLGAMRSNQDFGLLAAIALPVTLGAALSGGMPRALRITAGVLVVPTFYVLLSSLLRSTLVGGIVGVIAVVAVLAASDRGRRSVTVTVVAIAAIAAAGALLLPGASTDGNSRTASALTRASTIFDAGVDPAFQARTSATWPIALEVLSSNPWGGGPGAAGPVSQSRADQAPFGALTPDNGYLLIALQFGLQGVALFAVFLAAAGATLARIARAGSGLAAGAMGAVAGVAVAMLAAGLWGLVAPVSLLCLLIGLAIRTSRVTA